MQQFNEKQSLMFKIIDWLARVVYILRENYLLQLNEWLDRKAGSYWQE